MIRFSLDGLNSLSSFSVRLKTIESALNTASTQCAEAWVTYIKVHMTSSGPSAPGEYPAVISGHLRDSISVESANYSGFTIVAAAEYAGYLEEGTHIMQPRPFMWRAEAESELVPQFENIIGTKLTIHLERS